LQKKFDQSSVSYSALRVELSHLNPPVKYEKDETLIELCKGMAQMAPYSMFAGNDELNLSEC